MKNKLMNPMVDFAFKELFGSDEKEEVYRLAANRLKKLSADEIKQQEYYAREK